MLALQSVRAQEDFNFMLSLIDHFSLHIRMVPCLNTIFLLRRCYAKTSHQSSSPSLALGSSLAHCSQLTINHMGTLFIYL